MHTHTYIIISYYITLHYNVLHYVITYYIALHYSILYRGPQEDDGAGGQGADYNI